MLLVLLSFSFGLSSYFLNRFMKSVDKLDDTMKMVFKEFNKLENRIIKLETVKETEDKMNQPK